MSGRGVWFLVVVDVFLYSFPTANNWAFGSRSVPGFSPHPQALIHGSEEGWSRAGGGSYASAPRPSPWRPVASAVVAPTSLSPSIFYNNFVVQIEVSPLLELDLGDLWMDFSICCCLEVFTSEMQQVQIGVIVCLPNLAMVGNCGISVPRLLDTTRWSKCGWSMSRIWDLSTVLQGRILHMRSGLALPVPCFSAQSAVVKCEALRRGTDDFAQEMVIWSEAFVWRQECSLIYYQISAVVTRILMISNNWYAKLNHLHVFISDILNVGFQSVVFAAHCLQLQYKNWDNLPSVSSWRQVTISVADLLDNCVHTQDLNFRGSRNLGFGILQLQIDLNEDASIYLEFMASTIRMHEWNFMCCFCCTCSSLPYDRHVEDAVSLLFGLCHRRWTTTPPLLIPRFNGRDTPSLSSAKVIRYLQLSSSPRVHIPDRPLGEPPAGHQLDRTSFEALKDCRCGNFESGLSLDE